MKINRQKVLVWGLILASIYVVYRYWGVAEEILMTVFDASKPFFVGAMISYIVNILMDGYENLITRFVSFQPVLKMKRNLSLLLAYLTFAIAIIVILGIVIPELIRAVQSLLSIDPKTIQQIFKSMEDNGIIKQIIGLIQGDTSGNVDIVSTITGYVQQILSSIGNLLLGILTSATGIFSTVINVFMSIVFSIYVLISKDKLSVQFTNVLKAYVPDWYQTIEATIDVFNQSFRGFIVSQTIEAVILGSLCFVGMLVLRLPYASTVSIMIGSTSLIPLVGAFIGAIIGVVLILTQSVSQAFIFVIFIIVLQQVESNLIYPRVVGGSVGLPPMWVLVAISIGGAIANIFGMFVAVPIAAALYKLFRDDLRKRLANQTLT
ncbi:MAG TPA: AI-2E family transporter [Globicatella sulfidifaciens]|uniref:Predicted PurR-regulated permease PerM n=1 Tax=Globicatella sulfidifaciens DSM 15739 TaxID=1121925 RepID=A0A1T4MG84_9LACT|nr:AI-2E family transporter [Globicatella sulfidifaciens]SJZ65774.1 Predicted PurR-regulated permease PerM [Globicatella sulfidifaciens DSM 15739]HJF17400.1 AI-2E family transporter [Globicatella sulfidifaciens]